MGLKIITNKLKSLNWKDEQLILEEEPIGVSRYNEASAGKLIPFTVTQVQEALHVAKENSCSLYPFSRGNNWAFGEKTAFSSDCILLDLSQLQTISDYEPDFGRVRVQPGVSQGQLMNFLLLKESSFYIDVTGSGAETSVMGNALERGIAYNTLRAEQIESLEVLLPNGEIIKTGFSEFQNCDVKDLYGFGLGPDLRGLFLQSNLGIVLSMVIRLNKHQEKVLSFQLNIEEKNVGLLVDSISKLMQLDVLSCITHIGDPLRIKSTLEPILASSKKFNFKDKEYLFNRLKLNNTSSPIWSCLGNIQGTKKVVSAKKYEVNKELSQFGKVQFFDEEKISKFTKYLNWGPFKPMVNFLEVTHCLRGLVAGRATSEAVKMLYWSLDNNQSIKYLESGDIDTNSTPYGTLFCVPITTMNKEGANKLIEGFRAFAKKHNLTIGATLNTLTSSVLEAVISFHFDPSQVDTTEIHQLFVKLNEEFVSRGSYPYRMNPDLMKHSHSILPHPQLSSKLKSSLDPDNIISPNHYILKNM